MTTPSGTGNMHLQHPVVGETLPMQVGRERYHVLMRKPFKDWERGTVAHSACEAMLCLNVIRRMKPDMSVKVVRECRHER